MVLTIWEEFRYIRCIHSMTDSFLFVDSTAVSDHSCPLGCSVCREAIAFGKTMSFL